MFRLEKHLAISMGTGKEIELKQWRVFYGDVLVGYLQQQPKAEIQALFEFPHEALTDDVLAEFSMLNAEKLGVAECVVTGPEQYSRQFVQEAFAIKAAEEADDDE